MATASKTCRVCGKSYEACRSANRNAGIFRWQEVACSPECGAMYLKLVSESRKPVQPVQTTAPDRKKKSRKRAVAKPIDNTVFEAVVVEQVENADDDSIIGMPVDVK